MKNRLDIRDFILDLEKRHPVDQWKIDGWHIWPVIRIRLYVHLVRAIEPSLDTSGNKKKVEALSKNSPETQGKGFISNWLEKDSNKRFFAKLKLKRLKQSDFLFAEAVTHRAKYKGKSWSKLFDPIINKIEGKSMIIEHSPKERYDGLKLKRRRSVINLFDIGELVYFEKPKEELHKASGKDIQLNGYQEFADELTNYDLTKAFGEKTGEKAILYLAKIFNEIAAIYEEILDAAQPKFVFSACYYTFHVVVLNHLANKRGIPTIEIQHGPQSISHMAYSAWSKVPDGGFNTMPKVFWNWDEHSNGITSEWCQNTAHKAIVGGNPWVNFFRKNIEQKKEKRILYSLQPFDLDFLFRDEVIEMIKSSEQKWWIRSHPSMIKELDYMFEILLKNQLEYKVDVDFASQEPLPIVLLNSTLHVTHYSGCTIEAAQFGLKTILIDERGEHNFPELIRENRAMIANDLNAFPTLEKELRSENANQVLGDFNYPQIFKTIEGMVK